jgi:hypothetical protein
MIKRGNKRGSHVGVMISFALFVTFLLFLYALVQPIISSHRDKESLSTNLELAILNKISYDITVASIFLEDDIGSSCVKLNGAISGLGIGGNVAAEDNAGTMLSTYLPSAGSNDILVRGTSTSEDFIKICYSSVLDTAEISSLTCTELDEGTDYTIGLVKTQKYPFEAKIMDLMGEYSNYEILKNELNFPEGTEFGFGIILSNGTTIQTVRDEPSINIYIQDTPMQYVDLNGNIVMGYLKTKVW